MSSPDKPERPAAPLFRTGQIVATPDALRMLEQVRVNPMELLSRHAFGDWGELCEEDREANRQAVALGGRVFSSYVIGTGMNEQKCWCITEADRSSTTLLLPSEY